MEKIHLDTDLGGDTDDLCALAMLLKWPDLKITGITTVAEDNGKRAGYTKYALKLANREDIPVKAGADASGGYYRFKPGFPNESECWPEPVTPSPNSIDEALELLKSSIDQGATIVAIGPFTNLFLLDQKYPGILQDARLYLMGGYVYPIREGFPKWGHNMDYNIQVDVNSAKHVLENSNPTLIPLTVTVETALRRAYLPDLRKSGKLGEVIATQVEAINRHWNNEEKYGKTCRGLPSDILNFQHDPLACAIALGWNESVKVEEVPLKLEVKDSWLVENIDRAGRLTRVVTQIDGSKFNQFWLDLVTS